MQKCWSGPDGSGELCTCQLHVTRCRDIVAAVILVVGVVLMVVENYVSVHAVIVGTHQSATGQCQQYLCNYSNYTIS